MDKFKKRKFAKLHITIAMVTFGTIGVFVKNIRLSSAEIALWRGVLALVTLFIFLIRRNRLSEIKKVHKSIWKLCFSGAAMGFNWILLFEAYNYTTVALSTLSYYFAPTIIMLVSTFLFKEKLSLRQILCFLASSLGLIMIIGVNKGNGSDVIGIIYGLGAATLYATVVLFNKATGHVDGLIRTLIQFASAVLILIPYVYVSNGFHIKDLNPLGFLNLLILGVVHTGIIYFLYFNSLSYLSGQEAAILSYIDPTVAVFLSFFILGETLTSLQLIGGILLLLSTFINEVQITNNRKV